MPPSESQCIAQCLIDSFHSRYPPDGPSDKLQFYRPQVVGHDYRIGFQAGLESERVLQQDRDPAGMSGAGQIAIRRDINACASGCSGGLRPPSSIGDRRYNLCPPV
jgi:hypothetical protein